MPGGNGLWCGWAEWWLGVRLCSGWQDDRLRDIWFVFGKVSACEPSRMPSDLPIRTTAIVDRKKSTKTGVRVLTPV